MNKFRYDDFNFEILAVVARRTSSIEGAPGDSEAEKAFARACRRYVQMSDGSQVILHPQYNVGDASHSYRIDFAIPLWKIAIEIDGLAYHTSQWTFINDRKRHRWLELNDWRVVRFAAKEILDDSYQCMLEFIKILNKLSFDQIVLSHHEVVLINFTRLLSISKTAEVV